MRAINYIVIVVVLVVSAMLGRGYFSGSPLPAFQADLTRCLDTFWQTQGSRVEVLGEPARAEVRASVAFPPGTGPRQQQWMNAFIAFVASRHPQVKVGSVRVVPVSEPAATSLEADSARPAQYEDVTRAETVQRDLQARLDSTLGAGMALVLVDVGNSPVAVEAPVHEKVAADRVSPYANRLAPDPEGGAPAMESTSLTARRRAPDSSVPGGKKMDTSPQAAVPLLGCLVLQSEAAGKQAAELVRPSLGTLRLVVLP